MLSFPSIAFPPQGTSILTQRSQMKNCIFLFPAARCDTLLNVTALKANNPTHSMCFCLIKAQIIHRDLFKLNPNSMDSLNQGIRKTILKSAEFWRSTLQALRRTNGYTDSEQEGTGRVLLPVISESQPPHSAQGTQNLPWNVRIKSSKESHKHLLPKRRN